MSFQGSDCGAFGSGTTVTWTSFALRCAIVVLILRAVRQATPYSQLATISGGRTAAAFRASTKNVAWNASSASWWWPTMRRQTPSTSGP